MKKILELTASICIILIIIVIFIFIWDSQRWVLYLRIVGTAGLMVFIALGYAKLRGW